MVEALARRLGCSEGRVWTLGLALLVTAALVPATFPAGLRPLGDNVTVAAPPLPPGTLVPPVPLDLLPPIPLPLPLPLLQPQPQPGPQAISPPAPHPSPTPGVAAAPSPSAAPTEPLRMAQTGWYDADPEAPLRQQLTPVGELPVSADRGLRAATSVFRLLGTAPTLALAVDAGAGRTVGQATVELCRNTTTSWTGYDAMPTAAAPPYDTHCVAGKDLGTGRWSFAIGQLGQTDAETGFTLRAVVTASPTQTFAVTFFREIPS